MNGQPTQPEMVGKKTQKQRMGPRATAGGINGFVAGIIATALLKWELIEEVGPMEVAYITTLVSIVGGWIVSVIWPAIRARLKVPE